MNTMSYAEAVGTFVRDYRQQHGITLDSIAQLGREFGATWSLSSVQAIEGGKAAPTVPTLLTLALVLGRLSGEPIKLADLLGPAEFLDRPFIGSAGQPVRRSWVDGVLNGGQVEVGDADHAHEAELPAWDAELEEAVAQRRGHSLTEQERYDQVDALWEAMNQPPEPSVRRASRARASLAESRAAKKLAVQPHVLRQHAVELWGRSLEAEAASRAGAHSTPQARGRATRVLVEEIRQSLAEER